MNKRSQMLVVLSGSGSAAMNGLWRVQRSDDGGACSGFNDDAHPCDGRGAMAAGRNARGRIPASGAGRDLPYSN